MKGVKRTLWNVRPLEKEEKNYFFKLIGFQATELSYTNDDTNIVSHVLTSTS